MRYVEKVSCAYLKLFLVEGGIVIFVALQCSTLSRWQRRFGILKMQVT